MLYISSKNKNPNKKKNYNQKMLKYKKKKNFNHKMLKYKKK